MAGNYPDVPAPRILYDRDGTVLAKVGQDGTIVVHSIGNKQTLNNESGDTVSFPAAGGTFFYIAFIFPELRDILAYYFVGSFVQANLNDIQVSTDTTNGLDGAWVQVVDVGSNAGSFSVTGARNNINSFAGGTAQKAIRFEIRRNTGSAAIAGSAGAIHLYGSIAAGANPDRLRFWHPTSDAEITGPYFDLAEQPRGGSVTRTFRIKNNSAGLTANSIAVTREALTDTSPTNVGQTEFSTDNITFAASINIGNLAPGAISSVLYMRRTTSAIAALSLWWVRFVATASSWA